MNVIDRLLGRKVRTTTTISDRLEAARTALRASQGRISAAAERRRAAIASADRAAAVTAQADGDAAVIDAEIATGEVAALEAAHAGAVDAERAAARTDRINALTAEGAEIEALLRAEWDIAAIRLADMLRRVVLQRRTIREAVQAGEIPAGSVPDPEAFRGAIAFAEAIPTIPALIGTEALWPVSLPESAAEREAKRIESEREERRRIQAAESAARAEEKAAAFRAERQAEREEEEFRARHPYYGGRRESRDVAK